jgi:hypothetical protein
MRPREDKRIFAIPANPCRAGEQIPLLAELSMTCQAKQLISHARFANEYHGTKKNRIWKHDRIIVAQDQKATAYYLPRRCRQCQEIIVYNTRDPSLPGVRKDLWRSSTEEERSP